MLLLWATSAMPHLEIIYKIHNLPSQFSPVESREKPLWHSQEKLPGVF